MTEPDDGEDEPPECAACHRPLKRRSPDGLGPDCRRKLHGRTARRPRTTSAAAQAGPGQPELPYTDQLELDWSTE